VGDLLHRLPVPNNRPHSLLVPHVRLRDTHGWIGTQPGCLACAEDFGADYPDQPEMDDRT
jgi:hypothetical protein